MNRFSVENFKASGMTIRQLATRLDVNQSTVWRWVQNRAVPRPRLVEKLIGMGLIEGTQPRVLLNRELLDRVESLTAEVESLRAEIERLRALLGSTPSQPPCGGVL